MKKQIYQTITGTILLFFLLGVSFAQTVTLTFTGRHAANQYVQLERVVITNLTKGWCETLVWPDTVLTMQDGTLFGTEGEAPSPSELIKMNQLVSNIVGTIPDVSELNEAGRVILKAQSEFGAHTQIPDAVTEAAETEEKEEPGE